MKRIMLTGAVGQIGSELTMVLREKYGNDNLIATDHIINDLGIRTSSIN